MRNILDKFSNGYNLTYMGDDILHVLDMEIIPGQKFTLINPLFTELLNNLTEEERSSFIYEKIIISNYRMG